MLLNNLVFSSIHVFKNQESCGIFDIPGVAGAVLQKSIVINLLVSYWVIAFQFGLKWSHTLTVKASDLELSQNWTSVVGHSDFQKIIEKSIIGLKKN